MRTYIFYWPGASLEFINMFVWMDTSANVKRKKKVVSKGRGAKDWGGKQSPWKRLENKWITTPADHKGMKPVHVTTDMSREHSGFMFSCWNTFYKLLSNGMCVVSHGATCLKNWFRSRRFPQLVVGSSKSNSLSLLRAFVCKTFYDESRILLAGRLRFWIHFPGNGHVQMLSAWCNRPCSVE